LDILDDDVNISINASPLSRSLIVTFFFFEWFTDSVHMTTNRHIGSQRSGKGTVKKNSTICRVCVLLLLCSIFLFLYLKQKKLYFLFSSHRNWVVHTPRKIRHQVRVELMSQIISSMFKSISKTTYSSRDVQIYIFQYQNEYSSVCWMFVLK
jgi:hypothetical protein